MPDRYKGYNGSIFIGPDYLEISKGWLTSLLSSSRASKRVIALRDITGFSFRRPTVLLNGYVRIGRSAHPAQQLELRDAPTHPYALVFHHGQRQILGKLLSELEKVVDMNRSGDQADQPAQDGLSGFVSHIPRTDQELAATVSSRPENWEFRLFAGLLLKGIDELSDKWHDHEFRYARTSIRIADPGVALNYLSERMGLSSDLAGGVERLLTSRNVELAFGLPGVAGNPDRIRILAARIIEIYEGFLDAAAELRGASVVSELEEAFELAAQISDGPLVSIRKFVEETAVRVEQMIQAYEETDPGIEEYHLKLELTITVDDGIVRDCRNSIDRAGRRLKR